MSREPRDEQNALARKTFPLNNSIRWPYGLAKHLHCEGQGIARVSRCSGEKRLWSIQGSRESIAGCRYSQKGESYAYPKIPDC